MSLEGMRKDGVQLALLNKRGYVGTEIVGMETMLLLSFFFPLLHNSGGEGNGNPLQYSCLENPMDGGAW